jgi:hypothetical protein
LPRAWVLLCRGCFHGFESSLAGQTSREVAHNSGGIAEPQEKSSKRLNSLDSLPHQSGNGLAEKCAHSGFEEPNIHNDQRLAALPKMDRKALLTLWQELFSKPANPALRREVLIPILAYRLQEKAYGGLKAPAIRQLRTLVEDEALGRKMVGFPALRTKPGTRMVREWNGKLHEVSVLADGYEYSGRTYRSLSVIARAITGTRWSGPAFFGIKRHAKKGADE